MSAIFGFKKPCFKYSTKQLPIADFGGSSRRLFPALAGSSELNISVKAEQEIIAGETLGAAGDVPRLISPIKGKVERIAPNPTLWGAARATTFTIAADKQEQIPFERLNPETAAAELVFKRIQEAAVCINSPRPNLLVEELRHMQKKGAEVLLFTAFCKEPNALASMQLFKERSEEAAKACKMLGRVSGVRKVYLAVLEEFRSEAEKVCKGQGVEPIAVSNKFPNGFPQTIALKLGLSFLKLGHLTIETALAAYDAVNSGKIQTHKVITILSPEGEPKENIKVPIGVKISEIVEGRKIKLQDGDKIIAGGFITGYAQMSLDAPIDAGIDALAHLPAEKQIRWTNEPCINCGACIKVCPIKLQPHLLGRYSEYSFFERTEEYAIKNCIECGLCPIVCPAHRPLLQWIRLAKRELENLHSIGGGEGEAAEKAENESAA